MRWSREESVARSEVAATKDTEVGCGIAPSEGAQLQPVTPFSSRDSNVEHHPISIFSNIFTFSVSKL